MRTPWKNSSQYEILKRAIEVVADSDKAWRLKNIVPSIPDNAGVSFFERRRLQRYVNKKIAQKKAEIYQYELTKFALGEANDLHAAARNAESLGEYAWERSVKTGAANQAIGNHYFTYKHTQEEIARQQMKQQYNDEYQKMFGVQNTVTTQQLPSSWYENKGMR